MIEDLVKFKRVFVFGCSYTSYIYPGWAQLLEKECTNAVFYNLALPGSGNNLIAWRLAEASNIYNFNSNDLVIVMWTNFCREDRYVNGTWKLYGNVYNNNYYDEGFLKYTDPDGYAIQNCATIQLATTFLKSLPSTTLTLYSYNMLSRETSKEIFTSNIKDKLLTKYGHLFKTNFKPYIIFAQQDETYNLLSKDKRGIKYKLSDDTIFNDMHPNPLVGYAYLKYLNFPLTNLSYEYACKETQYLQSNLMYQSEIYDRYHTEKIKLELTKELF